MLSLRIVSIMFCFCTFEIENLIISHTTANTNTILIAIAVYGTTKSVARFIEKA